MECDQAVLKEMGVKKIGDRVRIYVAIKSLRNNINSNPLKRSRDSLAAVDTRYHTPYTPSSSSSPRHPPNASRSNQTTRDRRWSQVIDSQVVQPNEGRPSSPYAANPEYARIQNPRGAGMSPITGSKRENAPGYFASPPVTSKSTGGRPVTPQGAARGITNIDSTIGRLPNGSPLIRVIYGRGQTKTLDIRRCGSLEEIIVETLRKLNLGETHRNWCFWTLDGTGQNMNESHRLSDAELMKICSEPYDSLERGRLILRKKHAGEPDEEELRKASTVAQEEQNEIHKIAVTRRDGPNISKIEKLTGK